MARVTGDKVAKMAMLKEVEGSEWNYTGLEKTPVAVRQFVSDMLKMKPSEPTVPQWQYANIVIARYLTWLGEKPQEANHNDPFAGTIELHHRPRQARKAINYCRCSFQNNKKPELAIWFAKDIDRTLQWGKGIDVRYAYLEKEHAMIIGPYDAAHPHTRLRGNPEKSEDGRENYRFVLLPQNMKGDHFEFRFKPGQETQSMVRCREHQILGFDKVLKVWLPEELAYVGQVVKMKAK